MTSPVVYLRLMRIPAVFTAMADVAAGFFIFSYAGGPFNWSGLLALLAISGCLYSAGMVLNDCFDFEDDRVNRPERPLPAGEASLGAAVCLASVLIVGAILMAMLTRSTTAYYAGFIVLGVLLYDGFLKRYHIAGSVGMGACRFLNMQMGMTLSPQFMPALFGTTWMLVTFPPLVLLTYVTMITLASTMEDPQATWKARWMAMARSKSSSKMLGESKASRLTLGVILAGILATLALVALRLPYRTIPSLLLLGAVGALIAAKFLSAAASLGPDQIRSAVKWGLACIIPLDASFVAAYAGRYAGSAQVYYVAAGIILLSMAPMLFLSRKISVT